MSGATSQMSTLYGYASTQVATMQSVVDELIDYVSGEVNTTAPQITVDLDSNIEIDSALATIPQAPESSDYPEIPDSPTEREFPFPSTPAYTLPSVPELTDIAVPDFIEGTVRSLSTSIPTVDFEVPTIGAISTSDATFDSLLQEIRNKLLNNILYGGTMIDPDVEDDLWDRDKERDEQTLQDTIDKVSSQWAKMGFSLPDGLLAGSIIAINNEYANKRLDRSRGIAIKQAELEHDGLFKSLAMGVDLEKIIVGSANEYAKRVMDASKFTADVIIELYKQRVVQYNTLLETFKADVVAYKTNIEAEMVRADVYKTQLQALLAIGQLDETKVKLYTSQISGVEQKVKIYETEVRAAAAQYDAEKSRIEGFKSRVDAYVASSDSITKQYLAKIDGYKAFVGAWTASSDSGMKGKELQTRADIAELDATLKSWEVQLRLILETTTIKLEALKTMAQTSSNVAAGALSSIHASISDNYAY